MGRGLEGTDGLTIPGYAESGIIRLSDLPAVKDPTVTDGILSLLTPADVLERTEFELPEVIVPWNFPNFEALLARREDIRVLRLLPVKNDEEYKRYHDQSKESLVSGVERYLAEGQIALAPNQFPYFMPDDTSQNIVWMRNPNTSNEDLARFLASLMRLFDVSLDRVIFFERPMQTTSKLVRGTLPQYRHIHMWTKLQQLIGH